MLKTFLAVADHGGFAAAADVVNLSQAAVGQQMKRLEDTLHVTLFERGRTPVELNALGHALVPRARALVDGWATLLDDLPGSDRWVGELSLGAVPSTIRGLVPLTIKALMDNAIGVQVRVVPGLSVELLEQVERGALDTAIVAQPARLARSIAWTPLVDEALVLLAAPEVLGDDPFELLARLPCIRHTRRASVGELAEDWLAAHDITVHASMEMESLESVASMVAHGLGVAIAPDIAVPDAIFASLRRIPLPQPARHRSLGLVARRDSAKSALVARLAQQLVRTIVEAA